MSLMLLLLWGECGVDAFTTGASHTDGRRRITTMTPPSTVQPRPSTSRLLSSSNPEVEALLAAAAKAREEANRLSEVRSCFCGCDIVNDDDDDEMEVW